MESPPAFPDFQPLPAGLELLRMDAGTSWPGIFVVLRGGEGAAPAPVRLRTTTDATVWLGALCDQRRSVLRWLELWVQRTADAPAPVFGSIRQDAAVLDDRWTALTQAFLTTDPGRCLVTGSEDQPHPAVPGPGDAVFNPHGARVLVRTHPALTLEDYVRLLTTGRLPAHVPWLSGSAPQRDLRHVQGAFLQGWSGDRPPVGELLHLKVRLIAGLLEEMVSFGGARRMPLLNLTRHSWGVEWGGTGTPASAWTARPVLQMPPAVLAWHESGRGAEPVFFLNPEHHAPSIYLHSAVTPPRVVTGTVRLRDVRHIRHEPGAFECEGTLILSEPLPALTDILLVDCPLAVSPVQAVVLSTDAARGEAVFRSSPWQATPPTAAAIDAGGYSPPAMQCRTAIVPRLTAAADLYSVGVLALEILCCGNRQALPLVLDELVRLGRRLEQDDTPPEKVAAAMAALARREADAPWVETLHPRHLTGPSLPADVAWRAVPPEVWFSLLAICLRMLTGQTRYAWLPGPDQGVAPRDICAPASAALAEIASRTRGLAFMDWQSAREIREEILSLLR